MHNPENNWQCKSLENLENDFWGEPEYDSYLVRRTHEIRKLPLNELTNDDIAMMLRQKLSLDYIVPLAIEKLQRDIPAYGETGTEDSIMDAIIRLPVEFWRANRDHWNVIRQLLDGSATEWTFDRSTFDDAFPS